MTAGLLLVLLHLTTQQAAGPEADRPRFSFGAQLSGIAVNISEGSGAGFGAALTTSIPIGRRTAIDLRVARLIASGGFGFYDVRWRRMLTLPRNGRPDYAAVGLAGAYEHRIRYRGNVRTETLDITYPQMLSIATGWEIPAFRTTGVIVEVGGLAHPYGVLAGLASIGMTWGPRPLRDHP
jgi:hypothetical protein